MDVSGSRNGLRRAGAAACPGAGGGCGLPRLRGYTRTYVLTRTRSRPHDRSGRSHMHCAFSLCDLISCALALTLSSEVDVEASLVAGEVGGYANSAMAGERRGVRRRGSARRDGGTLECGGRSNPNLPARESPGTGGRPLHPNQPVRGHAPSGAHGPADHQLGEQM